MTTPIALTLNLNAEQQAPLASLRKKNLNHEKEDMIVEMLKATKATKAAATTATEQPKAEIIKQEEAESEEVPQPMPTILAETVTTNSDNTLEHDDTEDEAVEDEPLMVEHSAELIEEATAAQDEEDEGVEVAEATTTTAGVEQRLKEITESVGKQLVTNEAVVGGVNAEVGRRQSFMSLSDLIKNLRPNDEITPQIDSDYSNTMRVLGETASLVSDEGRKVRNSQQINRSLY